MQDTDIESAEAAALAAQAADLLTSAHAAAVEEANNQFSDDQSLGQFLFTPPLPVEQLSADNLIALSVLCCCLQTPEPASRLVTMPTSIALSFLACLHCLWNASLER